MVLVIIDMIWYNRDAYHFTVFKRNMFFFFLHFVRNYGHWYGPLQLGFVLYFLVSIGEKSYWNDMLYTSWMSIITKSKTKKEKKRKNKHNAELQRADPGKIVTG